MIELLGQSLGCFAFGEHAFRALILRESVVHSPALSGKMGNERSGKLLKNQGWNLHCRSENPRVGSSILPPATIKFNKL